MSTAELKEKVIAQINETDDDGLLDEISTMLDIAARTKDGVYEMSNAEIEAVEDGLRQLKNGQWITHEEAKRQVEEWAKK